MNHHSDIAGAADGRQLPVRSSAPTPLSPASPLQPAGYPPGMPEGGNDLAIDLLYYWRIFQKRKWLISGVVGAFLVLATLATLMQQSYYTATVRVQIDRESTQVVDKGDVLEGTTDGADFIGTQIVLLRGRGIAERTASSLGLDTNTAFLNSRSAGFSGMWGSLRALVSTPPAPEAVVASSDANLRKAAALIQRDVQISPIRNSRLIDIMGTSNNCALAIVDQIGFKDRTRFGSGGGFDGAVRFL